jgi:hypothetical protein
MQWKACTSETTTGTSFFHSAMLFITYTQWRAGAKFNFAATLKEVRSRPVRSTLGRPQNLVDRDRSNRGWCATGGGDGAATAASLFSAVSELVGVSSTGRFNFLVLGTHISTFLLVLLCLHRAVCRGVWKFFPLVARFRPPSTRTGTGTTQLPPSPSRSDSFER